MISHSRKVSITGSNFPKNRLFMVQKGTLFVPSLRVTGNVLRRLDCFHPLWTFHRFILLALLLLRDVLFSSYPRPNVFESCPTVSAMAVREMHISFKDTRQGARIADLHWSLYTSAHFLVISSSRFSASLSTSKQSPLYRNPRDRER